MKSVLIGSVGADDKGRGSAGNILFGYVDGNLASVRSGVAGGDYQFRGIAGSAVPKVLGSRAMPG